MADQQAGDNSFTEKIEVASKEILDTIKKLLKDGSVRRIVIRNEDGKQLLAVPMNAGVIGGGVAVMAAPLLSAITAIVALSKNVTLDVERTDIPDPANDVVVDAEVVDERTSAPGNEAH